MLETLDYTIRIGTFLYFDLFLLVMFSMISIVYQKVT